MTYVCNMHKSSFHKFFLIWLKKQNSITIASTYFKQTLHELGVSQHTVQWCIIFMLTPLLLMLPIIFPLFHHFLSNHNTSNLRHSRSCLLCFYAIPIFPLIIHRIFVYMWSTLEKKVLLCKSSKLHFRYHTNVWNVSNSMVQTLSL